MIGYKVGVAGPLCKDMTIGHQTYDAAITSWIYGKPIGMDILCGDIPWELYVSVKITGVLYILWRIAVNHVSVAMQSDCFRRAAGSESQNTLVWRYSCSGGRVS